MRITVKPTVTPIMTAGFFGECRGIGVDEEVTGDFDDEACSGSEMVRLWLAFRVVEEDADEKTDDDDDNDGLEGVKLMEEMTEFENVLEICEVDESGTPMVVTAVAFPPKRKGCPSPRDALQSQMPGTPSS